MPSLIPSLGTGMRLMYAFYYRVTKYCIDCVNSPLEYGDWIIKLESGNGIWGLDYAMLQVILSNKSLLFLQCL